MKFLFSILFTVVCFNCFAAPSINFTSTVSNSSPLKGDQVSLDLSLSNASPTSTGFMPYFRFVLPEGIILPEILPLMMITLMKLFQLTQQMIHS